jgi:formate dehydrogenase major subunit
MTNTWTDIGTSDVIMVIGGNPAENHPMAFKHITRALDNHYGNTGPTGNGAKLIVCDPRYTRTASKASRQNGLKMYTKFRSGTDIPLINGIIWHVMNNNLYNRAYVLSYSNAGFLINEGFKKPGDVGQNGVYSGFTATTPIPALGCSTGTYNKASWQYCKYVAGHPNEYRAVNIATDFWDGSGGTPDSYFSPNSGTTYDSGNLSLNPADATFIGNLRVDLFADGVLNAPDGFDPNQLTVWEHMQQHYSRYTKPLVLSITGADPSVYDEILNLYPQTGAAGKAGTIMYAMGTTQHTVGTQNIRGYSTLQILLGNMGVSGGGVNAQRGESNVQGSTDHCLLFHILPGYITMPASTNAGDQWFDQTNALTGDGTPGHPLQLPSYVKRGTPFQGHKNELNWWGFWSGQSNFKRYIASLMKCYWWDALGAGGDPTLAATPAQMQTVYDYIPKLPGNASHIEIFEQMHSGNINGLFCFGQNPAVGGPNSIKEREALRNLEFLVVSELWETETAAFWQYDTLGQNKLTPAQMAAIGTEVFLLPAACHTEKDGSVTNSSRWAQFRYKAVDPPGNNQIGSDGIPLGAKHEIWMINAIYEEIRALCNVAVRDDPIQNLTMGNWWYNGRCGEPIVNFYADPSADYLDKEINGQNASDNNNPAACSQVAKFTVLQDDGTTSSGNWLYCHMYDASGNKSKKRDNTLTPGMAPIYSNWSWDWPVNRRIIYNGASLVPCGFGGVTGTPWDASHPVIWWTGAGWGGDVNDGVGNPHGVAGHAERTPFIMKPEGHCRLHGHGRAEGPYPEHYEPCDTPYAPGPNPMAHAQLINPAIVVYEPGKIGLPGDYPIVATTYRCTEHWQAGAQTRHQPWQCEIMPNVVVEMSCTLATSLGISNGQVVNIETARNPGQPMNAYALVTDRFTTFNTGAGDLEHVGVFWHWGFKGIATGDSGNMLTPHVGDANTRIPEYKAFLCKIYP